MTESLRLAVYDLSEGRTALPNSASAVYFVTVLAGTVLSGGGSLALDEAAEVRGSVDLYPDAQAWLFEAAPAAAARPDASIMLSRVVDTMPGQLVRLDRVRSAAGAETPPHRHRGPGVRRLVAGEVLAQADQDFERILRYGAWYESGQETIIGYNDPTQDTDFYRLLLLPENLAGGHSSFVATKKEPAAKRNSSVKVYCEVILR